jgi:small subunit ribosomal protein S21
MKIIQGGPPEFDFSLVTPIEVVVEGSSREDFEYACRKFKMMFQKERIAGQLKEKSFYEKPSVRRRRKKIEARERRISNEFREKLMKSGEWEKRQKKRLKDQILKKEKRAQELLNAKELYTNEK